MLEGIGSESLDEVSEIVGDSELLEFRRGRRLNGGGRGGIDDRERGELRGDDLRDGEGLDLIGLLKRRRFDLVGFFRRLGRELSGSLGGFGD